MLAPLQEANIKSSFRQELVQAVVRDVPLCIISSSPSSSSSTATLLRDVIACCNSISPLLLLHIKSGIISCSPQIASLLLPPPQFNAKQPSPQPTRWEQALQNIIDSCDDDAGGEGEGQARLPARCFRSCVSFTMVLVVAAAASGKAVEPRDAAVALECIG